MLFVPFFAFHAHRAIAQLHKTDGMVAGAVLRDSAMAFWTMTGWRDETALQAYVRSGAHRSAMPHLADWGVEASVVRWPREDDRLPEWQEAMRRMRDHGRPSRLRYPGPDHAGLSFPDSQSTHGTRL